MRRERVTAGVIGESRMTVNSTEAQRDDIVVVRCAPWLMTVTASAPMSWAAIVPAHWGAIRHVVAWAQ
jgi:hypothetical protein